jgi:hypothetical protein
MTTSLPTTSTTPNRSRGILAGAAAVLAGGALVGGLAFGFGGTGTTPSAAGDLIPATVPTTHTVVIHDNTTHTVVTPAKPVPSSVVSTLQEELGQLNYYNGSIDGLMGPQTTAAITYLQRDAHLPQTGVMNAATRAALLNDLAHGNNQMAG